MFLGLGFLPTVMKSSYSPKFRIKPVVKQEREITVSAPLAEGNLSFPLSCFGEYRLWTILARVIYCKTNSTSSSHSFRVRS